MNEYLKTHNPDIVLVCETKLNKQKIHFNNYNFIRNDSGSGSNRGGTGILIKNTIMFDSVQTPILNTIESTTIKLSNNGESIYISSIYVTPTNNEICINELEQIMNISNNNNFIIGGDFNARHALWKNTNENKNGVLVFDWYMKTRFPVLLKSSLFPSRTSGSNNSFIDLFLISMNLNILYENGFSNFLKTHPFESDHNAVALTINLSSQLNTIDRTQIFNFSRINWRSFNRSIENGIEKINLPLFKNIDASEIDNITEKISDIFNETLIKVVPKITLNHDSQIPLSGHIIALIHYKNSLRRILFKQRMRTDNNLLKAQINCLNIMIRNAIRTHYNNYYSKKLSDIKMDKDVFKNIKRFSSYKARAHFPDIIADSDGLKIGRTADKTEALASHFI